MSPVTSLTLSLPSLRVHALSAGREDAPLVILLHGFPEVSESWRDVLPLLADRGFRAVAPDLRGYGETDKPEGGYDLDTLANDVRELADRLSPSAPVHVVGHDWGGAIAYHFAAFHAERVRTLSVVNCPHPQVMARRVWRPRQLRRSWYMFWFQVPLLPERLLSRDGGSLVPRILRANMKDRSRLTPERAEVYARNFARPEVARAALAYYREAIRGLLRPGSARRLLAGYPRIRAPFRLVWGTEDAALDKALTLGLGPYFAGTLVVDYLPGVGHFANIEAPEKVAASLLEHLEGPEPAPPA